jgi:hypothetical protein
LRLVQEFKTTKWKDVDPIRNEPYKQQTVLQITSQKIEGIGQTGEISKHLWMQSTRSCSCRPRWARGTSRALAHGDRGHGRVQACLFCDAAGEEWIVPANNPFAKMGLKAGARSEEPNADSDMG